MDCGSQVIGSVAAQAICGESGGQEVHAGACEGYPASELCLTRCKHNAKAKETSVDFVRGAFPGSVAVPAIGCQEFDVTVLVVMIIDLQHISPTCTRCNKICVRVCA